MSFTLRPHPTSPLGPTPQGLCFVIIGAVKFSNIASIRWLIKCIVYLQKGGVVIWNFCENTGLSGKTKNATILTLEESERHTERRNSEQEPDSD